MQENSVSSVGYATGLAMAMVPASSPREREVGSLSGARADFVAHLGRRVSELRQGLQALENDPSAIRTRDDLKRRFHALGSAARVLKFHALADELLRLEQVLVSSTKEGALDRSRVTALQRGVDVLVGLAWGEAALSPPPSSVERNSVAFPWPASALVVGPASLAEALLPEMSSPGEGMLECERIEVTPGALEMARALAPDVVVLDTELPGSQELVEKLASDPLTEPVPVVAVGSFSTSERAARWVALGVARVVARPFTPRQLQEACLSVMSLVHRPPRPEPLGQVTLEQLVVRLQEEIRRGLCEAALDQGRLIPVPLGDGHEILAALWSALVRIREVTTVRSGGLVRFQHLGPEGSVAVASWTGESRGVGPRRGDEREAPQRLEGRTVLVVDDDPSVTWFLAGVLRTAGATVLEAHDGETAWELAQQHSPELVISDILMPRLDGFALCRALKRDMALRDVPVILLSWKEDLLQRVRELGANADGYLRKEASAAVVLEHVFEVLRPRLRVERRLQVGGEVRGRLDDLTVCTLLTQVARLQPNARVSVRDAVYLYEIELREGAPRSAIRTTSKGHWEHGSGVLFHLLGVGAGRFVVTPSDAPLRSWLEGSLHEQIRPAIAQIRAAQRLLLGTGSRNVQGVELNLEALQPYLEASPTVSREILNQLAKGVSPQVLLLQGGYPARLLEDVLNDAILHGGVVRIVGMGGEDLLPSAVEQELQRLKVSLSPSSSAVLPSPHLPVAVVSAPLGEADPLEVASPSVAPSWFRADSTPSPFESALQEVTQAEENSLAEPMSVEAIGEEEAPVEVPREAELVLSMGSSTSTSGGDVDGVLGEERREEVRFYLSTPLQVSVEDPPGAALYFGEPLDKGRSEPPPPVLVYEDLRVPPAVGWVDEVSEKVSRETSLALEPSPGPQTVESSPSVREKEVRGRRGAWAWVVGVLLLGVAGSVWA
ncbi:MAG: response regulator, partial [Polyangiaceae bacterium]|nr:response regulator [Polyangiaceae bacterium]